MHFTPSRFHEGGITDTEIIKVDEYFSIENIGSELIQATLLGLSLCLRIYGVRLQISYRFVTMIFTHAAQAQFLEAPKSMQLTCIRPCHRAIATPSCASLPAIKCIRSTPKKNYHPTMPYP